MGRLSRIACIPTTPQNSYGHAEIWAGITIKSTPYRHESNATCERCVRSIVEGARALLEKAGLPSCFWIFAVRFYCFMHNTHTPDGGQSPWLRRFGEEFKGKRLPFGSLVNFLPKPETLKALPKFEPRGQQGILVGYRLHNGGK